MVGHAPAGHALVVVAAEGVVQRDMRDAGLLPEADLLAPVIFSTSAGRGPDFEANRRPPLLTTLKRTHPLHLLMDEHLTHSRRAAGYRLRANQCDVRHCWSADAAGALRERQGDRRHRERAHSGGSRRADDGGTRRVGFRVRHFGRNHRAGGPRSLQRDGDRVVYTSKDSVRPLGKVEPRPFPSERPLQFTLLHLRYFAAQFSADCITNMFGF